MNKIKYILEFIFGDKNELLLKIETFFNNKQLELTLSSYMKFLYENEKTISQQDQDFSYTLLKILKKVQIKGKTIFAINNDTDMAYLFKKAIEQNIELYLKLEDDEILIKINDTLPITITVNQEKNTLICTLSNHSKFLNDPLQWMTFNYQGEIFYFSQGVISNKLTDEFIQFLDEFLDKTEVRFGPEKAEYFIRNIFDKNKKNIFWQITADFQKYLPEEIEPIAVLKLNYDGRNLSSSLNYKYGQIYIEPNFSQEIIIDSKSGKKYLRYPDLEEIYQKDLMALYAEYNLPYLLDNPSDMAKFMSKIVPELKKRSWEIESNVPEFQVDDTPYDLEFTMQSSIDPSSGIDWFYFESNAEINGQKFSCQEIARLMVQNQGYIKTKKGFVKLSEKSQEELKLLGSFKAFKVGQKFTKQEVLPLLATASISGGNTKAKSFIDNFKLSDANKKCIPSKEFQGQLRDYQQFGISWIDFLARSGLGGILADDMGLGKTVQVIAFVSQLEREHPILVVGPTNVVYNWESEINKFLPSKNIIVYTGQNRVKKVHQLTNSDFIITTFHTVKNDIEIFSKYHYSAIFVDEAQYIKNPQAQISQAIKMLNADFRLAMTGTPIENHLGDLWSLFDFIMPNYLGTKRHFDLAVKDGKVEFFKTKIKPFVLRREKREVLDSLPEKTEIITKCEMSEAQSQLYQTVLSAVRVGVMSSTGQRERLNILASLLKLRQVCVYPGLLKEFKGQEIESAKFNFAKERILELVDEDHKITLFTQFTGVLDAFANWCEEEGIYFERIDGSISGKARQDAVNRFQSTNKPGIFLISLKAGGVGINLTTADYVFHLDPWWNPAIEAQATDRVHRMGQKNKVIVYKFITKGTIEEKIHELQTQKRELLAKMIEADNFEEKTINIEELKALLV